MTSSDDQRPGEQPEDSPSTAGCLADGCGCAGCLFDVFGLLAALAVLAMLRHARPR